MFARNANQPTQSSETNEDLDKLNKLVADEVVLYQLSSVFPIDLFPTKISIEKTQVNFVDRIFFGAEEVTSVLIHSISNVEVDRTLFLATLRVTLMLPGQRPVVVKNLWQHEAFKARRIIQGLMTGLSQDIDLSQVPSHELLMKVEELGSIKIA